MNKKIYKTLGAIASIAIPATAMISCGTITTKTEITNPSSFSTDNPFVLKGSNFAADGISTSSDGIFISTEESKRVVKVVSTIDKIKAPDTIAVDAIGKNIVDNITFIKNFQKVYANNSPLVTYEFLNNSSGDWDVDSNGTITKIKNGGTSELKITVGSVSTTLKIIQRAKITKQILNNFGDIATDSNVQFPSLWGTTTTVQYGKFNETGTEQVLKVNIADVNENTGGNKSYGYISNMKSMVNKVSFDSTVNYIGLRVYIPQNMVPSKWWFRSYYDGGQNIDFNSDANAEMTTPGWHFYQKRIDHSTFTNQEIHLDRIKIIQMNADHDSLSGSIYIAGIYVSDDEMIFGNA